MNNYFTAIMAVVSHHAGDVMRFAGDSLICMFPAPEGDADGGVKAATLRGTQCAWSLITSFG